MEYRARIVARVGWYVVQRVALAALTAVIVAAIVFALIRVVPGDAALILTQQTGATEAQLAQIRSSLGLDQPVPAQFVTWIAGMFRGELGRSYTQGVDSSAVIGAAAANTLLLGACAVILAIAIGLALGNLASVRSRRVRRAADWVEAVLLSAPQYTVALVLMIVFAVVLPVLPSGGLGDGADAGELIRHLTLPAIALSLPFGAQRARSLKASIGTLQSTDLLPALRSRGLSPWRLTLHVHQNALPPMVTVLGFQVGTMLGGALFVETIFGIPGLGQALVSAVSSRDYALVQSLSFVVALIFIGAILAADILNLLLDPRLRRGLLT